MQLTKHFTSRELTYSIIAERNNLDNTPSDEVFDNLRLLALKLEEVRTLLGDKPIVVTSCYRSLEVNKRAGGVANSHHISGHAVDFVCMNGRGVRNNALTLIESDLAFDQLIVYKSFIHLSVYPTNRRQVIYM